MDSFGLIDTDALIWTEADVRAGLVRVANTPNYFPNEHVAALVALVMPDNGAGLRMDWRKTLVILAETHMGKLIENRRARIVVGMQAEDNSGPERSKVKEAETAMQVDDSYIP